MLVEMSGAIARMLVLLLLASCGLLQGGKPSNRDRPKPGVEITLYRDHAVVAHRLDVTIPPAATAKVTLRVAAGVDPDDLHLVEPTELSIKSRVARGAPSERPASGCDEVSCVMDGERECCARKARNDAQRFPLPCL